MKHFSDPLT